MKLRCEICKELLKECYECEVYFDKEDFVFCAWCGGGEFNKHFCSLSCLVQSKLIEVGKVVEGDKS